MQQGRGLRTAIGQGALALMMCAATIAVVIAMLQVADRALGNL